MHETVEHPRRMPAACYLKDPMSEVHSWFLILANSDGVAARDPCVWTRMPLYSEYIARHSLNEIVGHSLQSIQRLRGLDCQLKMQLNCPQYLGTQPYFL